MFMEPGYGHYRKFTFRVMYLFVDFNAGHLKSQKLYNIDTVGYI